MAIQDIVVMESEIKPLIAQHIADQPQLQISSIKTKYLVSAYFFLNLGFSILPVGLRGTLSKKISRGQVYLGNCGS
jgi:hypothetical protein